MSADQTTPQPPSATLADLRGTAEPAEADSTEATAAGPVDHALAADPAGIDPGGGASVDPASEHPAESLDEQPATEAADQPGATNPAGEPARQPVGSSWQAEASGRLVAMSFPGARRIAGWLFWVVFPLLCLATIHTSVTNVAHHLGNKPIGIRGNFVVQPRSCSQGFCSFGGLFTSDDHTIKNLPLLGDPRWHTADVLRVTYDPRSVEVTALPGHWDPTASVMAAIGALTYLVLLGYFVREQRRSGRSWRRLASSA